MPITHYGSPVMLGLDYASGGRARRIPTNHKISFIHQLFCVRAYPAVTAVILIRLSLTRIL